MPLWLKTPLSQYIIGVVVSPQLDISGPTLLQYPGNTFAYSKGCFKTSKLLYNDL